jgi:aspartyl protease family protein
MFSGPLKLFCGAGFVAVIMASALSPNAQHPGGPSSPQKSKGLFSGWFDGTQSDRAPAPQPGPPPIRLTDAPPASAAGFGRMDIKADARGQFNADVEIEGQRIPMLVDTGATLITLAWPDAQRIGVRPAPADFKINVHTASGIEKGARVNLAEVRVGSLTVRNVEAIVLPEKIQASSLLGMSFLQKVKFEIADGSLILRQ